MYAIEMFLMYHSSSQVIFCSTNMQSQAAYHVWHMDVDMRMCVGALRSIVIMRQSDSS